MAKRYRNVIGEAVISRSGKYIGEVTDQYNEDGKEWILINEDYEQKLSDFEYVMDLTQGGAYLREK